MKHCAWIYPGPPATNAPDTYRCNRIDILRVQYFSVDDDTGTLKLMTRKDYGANGFSDANMKDIKHCSEEQLITVSSGPDGMRLMLAANGGCPVIDTLVAFVRQNQVTGIDIDFEGFGSWLAKDFKAFKMFVCNLGNSLHRAGKKLAVCTPTWSAGLAHSPLPNWDYRDLVDLPIDYVSALTYDYQYDMGGGSPVAPLDWLTQWTRDLLAIFGPSRLVIGIPAYGYVATPGKWDIRILTLDQIKSVGAYLGAKRDPASGECMKQVNGKVYVSNDATSMAAKRAAVQQLGVQYVSVWHLGGNDWFQVPRG